MRPKSHQNTKKEAINVDLIDFVDGICPACRWAEEKRRLIVIDGKLEQICDKYRKGNGEYDVIVPSSGGKIKICKSYTKTSVRNDTFDRYLVT